MTLCVGSRGNFTTHFELNSAIQEEGCFCHLLPPLCHFVLVDRSAAKVAWNHADYFLRSVPGFFTTPEAVSRRKWKLERADRSHVWLRLQEIRMDTTAFDRTRRTNRQTPCKAQRTGFFSFCGDQGGNCRAGCQSKIVDDPGSVVSREPNKNVLGVAEMFKPAPYNRGQMSGGRLKARRTVEFNTLNSVLKVAHTDTKSVWCGLTREPREAVWRSDVNFENRPDGQMCQRMHMNRCRQENGKDLLCGSRNKILH